MADGKTYYWCRDCGWTGPLAYTKKHICPDCKADNPTQVQIKMLQDIHRKAWVGFFADTDGHQISPMKAGRSEEEVRRRLEDMGGY